MPKKRSYNFKQLQGASSSNSAGTGNSSNDNSSPSVNERLSELRKLESKDAAARKRELADSVNKRSVPPQVQGILGVPESAPPKPKVGVRTRERIRTPGPAPPKSWLVNSSVWTPAMALRGVRRGLRKSANGSERSRPKELLRFARLSGLENDDGCEARRSLMHFALKAIAESWDLFDEADYPALADVPLRLRLRLISYIVYYGPTTDTAGIKALLQGSEKLDQLDLASLIGHGNLTLKKLTKLMAKNDRDELHSPNEMVLESWDADESFEQSLRPSLNLNRAVQLTHLCLSHPGPGISWRDLLAFSKTTPQVTHLSLAYWPWPSLTPNLATATVSSQNSPDVNASGTHYYAAFDQDMEEPASLLRQLSSHLLCLQWLDIDGCPSWAPALAELSKFNHRPEAPATRRSLNDDWAFQEGDELPVLASNWKNLTHIRCAQGWLPSHWGMRAYLDPASRELSGLMILLGRGVMYHLECSSSMPILPPPDLNQDMIDVERKKARLWLQNESRITHAGMKMNMARRGYACKGIDMDYGWEAGHDALDMRSRG